MHLRVVLEFQDHCLVVDFQSMKLQRLTAFTRVDGVQNQVVKKMMVMFTDAVVMRIVLSIIFLRTIAMQLLKCVVGKLCVSRVTTIIAKQLHGANNRKCQRLALASTDAHSNMRASL